MNLSLVPDNSLISDDMSRINDIRINCGHCGNSASAKCVAYYLVPMCTSPKTGDNLRDGYVFTRDIYWLYCESCGSGSVLENSIHDDALIYPPEFHPLRHKKILGLPDDIQATFNEALEDISNGSYTSCALICRKLLLYIAVDKCNINEKSSFNDCIEELKNSGHLDSSLKDLADQIRDVGNNATHKLKQINKPDANDTMKFTIAVLRSIYENAQTLKNRKNRIK